MAELNRILRLINKTFNKGAWHGPTVREVLEQVTPEQAHLRAGKSHSIAALVLHMISWRTFAVKRLRGDADYQVSDEMNFPLPGSLAWKEVVEKLEASQQELEDAVRSFSDDRLGDLVPGASHKYTFYTLLHGIIQHDIYHIGQIQLILRSNAPA